MKGVEFPEANCRFGPPPDLDESQCYTIPGFRGIVERGSVEGSAFVVVCHAPTPEERAAIAAGAPIFVTMMGGLAPHFLTTNFAEAINLA